MVEEKLLVEEDVVAESAVLRMTKNKLLLYIAGAVVALGLIAGCVTTAILLGNSNKKAAQLQQTLASQEVLLGEQQTAMSSMNAALSAKQSELDKTIADQKKVVEELQKQINSLKAQIPTKAPTKGNISVQNRPAVGKGGSIALTFDDGPGAHTGRLLDILKKHGVKATFFLQGKNAVKYPDLIKRMKAEGHEIGNHTYDHKSLTSLNKAGIQSQLNRCDDAIFKAIGEKSTIMRPPYGNNNATVRQVAKEMGIPVAYWSVDTRDWASRNNTAILNVVFGSNGVRDGAVVLMHDIHSSTVDSMDEMLTRLKNGGYTCYTMTELIKKCNGGAVQAGVVYMDAYL